MIGAGCRGGIFTCPLMLARHEIIDYRANMKAVFLRQRHHCPQHNKTTLKGDVYERKSKDTGNRKAYPFVIVQPGVNCGALAIRQHIQNLGEKLIPSVSTIGRILSRHGLTHARTGLYPGDITEDKTMVTGNSREY